MTEFSVTIQEGLGGEAVTFFCTERPRYVARYVEGEEFHVKGYHIRDIALRGIEFIPTNGPSGVEARGTSSTSTASWPSPNGRPTATRS